MKSDILFGLSFMSTFMLMIWFTEQIADLQSIIEKQTERIRYVESQLRLHYEE